MHSTVIDSWVFMLGDDPRAANKNADESEFRPVRVPHDWAVEHPFDPACSSGTGYLPGGVGWYRTRCSLRDLGADRAAAVRLVFHGVYKNADVWVNGYHLGGRPSGHAEFSFDLTEIISYAPDDDLVISVRVDHRDLADSRWYNGAGLTHRVDIEAHDAVSPARHGTTVTTVSAQPSEATLEVVQRLHNHTDTSRRVAVSYTVEALGSTPPLAGSDGSTDPGSTDPGSTDPGSTGQMVEVPPRADAELRSVVTVPDPRLWADDHPDLYRLVTTITPEDGATGPGRHEQVFGIRTFAFHPDTGFSINGEPRILKGVCLHEDAGCLGTAVPAEVWLRRLLALKEAGCNAVRMAHNPHSPELYELCDLLGLYVIDEAFDEWENPKNKWWQGHNVYPPQHHGYAHDFPTWHVRDLESMVDAHRRHPSVIAWSIGNEIDYPNDPYASALFSEMVGNNDHAKPEAERRYDPARPDIRRLTTIANELIDVVAARDASRPVTLAAAFPELSSRTGLLDRLGLIGYNYKEHLYAEDHRRFPDQPFVGSETSHTYRDWRHVVDQDFVAGQFLWTGIDYLGETPGWPSHGSAAGLLTTAGFRKQLWHLRRSWWSDEPVIKLAVHPAESDPAPRRPSMKTWQAGSRLGVVCFTNAEELEVTHGTERVAMTYDPDEGFWRGVVTAGQDPIVATGRVGTVTVRDELASGSEPVRLAAAVWQVPQRWRAGLEQINRGRGEIFQVECSLVDEQGRVAHGQASVRATVRDGQLLGLDNGDLTDLTPYTADHRTTLDGQVMVYVRGSGATVTLQAAGLAEAVVQTPGGRPSADLACAPAGPDTSALSLAGRQPESAST